jgi:signal transduction histidine kinase/CheY-like chemotaxis protein
MSLFYVISIVFVLSAISIVLIFYRKKLEWDRIINDKQNDIKQNLIEINNPKNSFESRYKSESQKINNEIIETKNRNESLKAAIEKEEKANYMKNVFLTNVSNEIRNPLNGILGFANLLKTEMAQLNRDDLYEFGNSISQSGENLLNLLSDIIDISRIEANDISFDLFACDLKSIINDSIAYYKKIADEKGIQIICDKNLNYNCLSDKETLSRIVNSVLDNSVRFTDKGYIKIGVKSKDDIITISIKDTGIGIDPTYIPLVFEPYRQETLGYSTKYQGAGLSLPLAKKALDLMNGNIIIESEKGHGTEVFISLQVASEAYTQKQSKKGNKSLSDKVPWKNKNILLVEDDKINQILFTKLLLGCNKLVVCGSGEETLDKLTDLAIDRFKIDFVLMDINLPGEFDGIKLMHRIKKDWPVMDNIPFIAQTAYAMSNEREKLLNEGFDEYLSKPIKKTELISVVEKVLNL